MPLYEYQCPSCGRFERIQKFADPLLNECPTCGKPVTKLLSAPAIQFKGSGWYITDYARKAAGGNDAAKPADGAGSSKDSTSKDAAGAKESSSTPKESSTAKSAASGSTPAK